MKIEIIAISPNDGWAFITIEDKIFLLRPPYISSNQIEVLEKEVENAIYMHGFEKCNISHDNIKNVIRYLKKQYIKSKKNQNISLPTSEQLRELLKFATDDVLLKYLERTKKELLPQGKLYEAESIAIELMRLGKVKNNNEMLEMVITILEECRKRKTEKEKIVMQISDDEKENLEAKFPNAVKRYSPNLIISLKEKVTARGSIFPIFA
ncbi:MAG: hypothetical protein K8S18_19095 [Desulfobacula sp.]|nr:hypothetical protein [Desulfobacula sp.]